MNPLDAPAPDSPVLRLFLRHFGLAPDMAPLALLEGVSRAFATIPYENLTKIIKLADAGSPRRAKRGPLEVVSEHVDLGAGGTCFSLTAALLHILRALGFEVQPILADRNYGANTHCALIVWIDGAPHVLDPGYLIVRPVGLEGSGEIRVPTAFNEILLVPQAGVEKLDLYTIQNGNRTYRLTFKADPVDDVEFLKAWEASFDWDMMRYPVLTRVRGDEQLYLQGERYQVRTLHEVIRQQMSKPDIVEKIKAEFGVGETVARRAFEVLSRTE